MGKRFITPIESDVPNGTSPMVIDSSTLVTNLNADLLDGQHGSYYIDTSSTSQTKTGNLTSSGKITGDILASSSSYPNEGGEIQLALPSSGSTLNTLVTIDVYQNRLRFFEAGGTNRGCYIDLTAAEAGVGTNLVGGGSSGTVTSVGVSVPTGLSVTNTPVTTSGTIAISLSAGYTIPTTASIDAKAPLASPTFTGTVTIPTLGLTTADTATTSSHYMVEVGSDGVVRPKTLANVQTEIVTNTIVQSTVVSPTTAGSKGIRQTTMSTSTPSGGADGDVWFVYT